MIIKVRITTPKGYAKSTQNKLKKFILGARTPIASYVNEDDSMIYWEVSGVPRDVLKVQRNIALYETLVSGMLNSKLVKSTLRKQLSPEDEAQLKSMLFDQTKVEVIKREESEDFVEANKTFWERMKEKFRRF